MAKRNFKKDIKKQDSISDWENLQSRDSRHLLREKNPFIIKMEKMILSPFSKEELVEEIVSKLKEALSVDKRRLEHDDELIKPKDAAHLLQISAPTLINWTKKGLLTAYYIGRRKFYKKTEIIDSLSSTSKL